MKTILLFAGIAFFASACKKDDSGESIPFSAAITITSPAESETIGGGTSFGISGTIAANREMHGYHLTVYNQNDQTVIYENQYHDHAESFTISETVTHTLTAPTPLRLVVEAAGDHEGESAVKEVLFGYAP